MKRIHLAPLALSIGLVAAGTTAALAQTTSDSPADFGPPQPEIGAQPQGDTAVRPPAQFELAPAPADQPEATEPPPVTQFAPPPAAADEAPVTGDTRRAAPDPRAPAPGADAQTGPYLGHGLFNNSGPDDFGA